MATKLSASDHLAQFACERYDAGERCGHGQTVGFETGIEIAVNAVRIHGGYGYSTDFDVEQNSGTGR